MSKTLRLNMMNLGDGLLFELENGKPRLVLAKNGAESKTSNKKGCSRITPRQKPQKVSSKQGPPQLDKVEPERKSKHTAVTHRPRVTNSKNWTEMNSDSRTLAQQKESMVCLTQEQFQQILSTINGRSTATEQHDPNTHTHSDKMEENCPTTEEIVHDGCNQENSASEVKTERQPLSDGDQAGFFSTFGERERERDKLEARKAQWRRELDEQMASKRQQKASLREMKARSETSEVVRLKDVGLSSHASAGVERSNPSAQRHTHTLPAAIRSALVVGEAAPVEDVFSAQRSEQQRLWLKELERQRDEDKLRRQHEREINSKTDDVERWTAHFDSLNQPWTHHVSASAAPSAVCDGASVCGADSVGRASVDTTQGNQQRSSYLRTMTALLDPAQIEERERRRLKQIQHQHAIEAQVEERRRQKEKEEQTRRAEEEEEEKRIERERERLQQQYIQDTTQQRHREEMQSRKTEELYLSIQRAQEEASKVKHLQRIRDLTKKGHDVSRLLHSLEGDSASQALSGQDLPATISTSSENQTQTTALPSSTSPRRDTAVQTEMGDQPENEPAANAEKQSPNAEETSTAPPNYGNGKKSHHGEVKASEKHHTREQVYAAFRADPYELYARSHKPEKRPEWNTHRPAKTFVPASERYPEDLRRLRQESRRLRQMEMMTLVDRNSRTPQQETLNHPRANAKRHRASPQPHSANHLEDPSAISAERKLATPPAPAVKSRVRQPSPQPPLSDYVPYVRTDEVYHMDPRAPLSRPSTHEAAHRVDSGVNSSRQDTPPVQHESVLPKSTERQQAILKGLSELRQGLLQRQKELETSLNPALQTQHRNYFSPFRPV